MKKKILKTFAILIIVMTFGWIGSLFFVGEMEYSDVMQCRVICVFMQKNWDKWKSILKINNVTTFLLCVLHKFKK